MGGLPMSTPFFIFPAVRGIQAGKEYYISMCPLKIIPKIFLFNEEELLPEFRAQRIINKSRVPAIKSYIVNNPKSYTFSSLTASIDADVEFIPVSNSPEYYNIGSIKVPMCAKVVINDGQHRRAAIECALKERPELGDETISIVFFIDLGLEKSQQMFSDLNRYAIRPTKSLNVLYDHRDPFSNLIKELILKVKMFKGLVETEKSTLSNRSMKIFTLSGIFNATVELFKDLFDFSHEEKFKLAIHFWNTISENIQEWQQVLKKELAPVDLRKDFINGHTIALIALGKAGHDLIKSHPTDWKEILKKLRLINWRRDNSSVWEGRVTIGGRISNSRNNITLITNYIKSVLGLDLNDDEKTAESNYLVKVV